MVKKFFAFITIILFLTVITGCGKKEVIDTKVWTDEDVKEEPAKAGRLNADSNEQQTKTITEESTKKDVKQMLEDLKNDSNDSLDVNESDFDINDEDIEDGNIEEENDNDSDDDSDIDSL